MTKDNEMTWRYCVTLNRSNDVEIYEVRELYTRANGELSWTAEASGPYGESWSELSEDMLHIERAVLSADVLDISDPENPVWVRAHQGAKS